MTKKKSVILVTNAINESFHIILDTPSIAKARAITKKSINEYIGEPDKERAADMLDGYSFTKLPLISTKHEKRKMRSVS